MKGCRILLLLDSTTFKLAPSLGLRSTGLQFLGTYLPGYRGRMEFPVPLLNLLQLQGYLVPFISAKKIIIPKLQNILWRQFFYTNTLSEHFLFSSNIFLIAILLLLLVPPPFIFTIAISVWTCPLMSTFPVLFRLK